MRSVVTPGITKLIGNTPLIRVRIFEREFPRLEVYAKAEWFNPGGSVKDRAALSMIEDGERRGALDSGQDDHRLDLRQHRHRVCDGRPRRRAIG